MNSKCPGVYTYEYIDWATKISKFFDLHVLSATMMVRMVLPVIPRRFAAFQKKTEFFKTSHENRYLGHEMSYKKASKKLSNTLGTS